MSNDGLVPFATTLLVRDTCLCLHVQRAARVLGRVFDDALRPFGLTNGQFSLLMSLNRPEPPGMAQVAALLGMDRTTLTAALKALERRGLVTIRIAETDRRARKLALTDAGRTALAASVPTWQRVHGEIEARLAGPAEALRGELRALG